MPRTARQQSSTGVYHIVMRGNNKQQVFLDKEDNLKFLYILSDYKASCCYELIGYCFMGNHLHLLIKTGDISIGDIMKRVVVRFVHYYNKKYDRTGHLFQDRFKSENVEDETYLIEALRYIHQNPVKAGLCEDPSYYPYSSWREYLALKTDGFADISYILSFISLAKLKEFHKDYKTERNFIDVDNMSVRISDNEALKRIKTLYDTEGITNAANLSADKQKEIAAELKKNGLSLRQIMRLTGIPRRFVE